MPVAEPRAAKVCAASRRTCTFPRRVPAQPPSVPANTCSIGCYERCATCRRSPSWTGQRAHILRSCTSRAHRVPRRAFPLRAPNVCGVEWLSRGNSSQLYAFRPFQLWFCVAGRPECPPSCRPRQARCRCNITGTRQIGQISTSCVISSLVTAIFNADSRSKLVVQDLCSQPALSGRQTTAKKNNTNNDI